MSATQTQFVGGIHLLAVLPVSSDCSESASTFIAATSAKIPDLADAGLRMLGDELQMVRQWDWSCRQYRPLASPGALALVRR
jgi:hypothetical protein